MKSLQLKVNEALTCLQGINQCLQLPSSTRSNYLHAELTCPALLPCLTAIKRIRITQQSTCEFSSRTTWSNPPCSCQQHTPQPLNPNQFYNLYRKGALRVCPPLAAVPSMAPLRSCRHLAQPSPSPSPGFSSSPGDPGSFHPHLPIPFSSPLEFSHLPGQNSTFSPTPTSRNPRFQPAPTTPCPALPRHLDLHAYLTSCSL